MKCSRCNRVLTDPVSIQRRIGPVCLRKERGAVLYLQSQPSEEQMDIFKTRSAWHHQILIEDFGLVVCIWDDYSEAEPTMSVTNDAENVVKAIMNHEQRNGVDLSTAYWIYVDTEGVWDRLLPVSPNVVMFESLAGDSCQAAIETLRKKVTAEFTGEVQ